MINYQCNPTVMETLSAKAPDLNFPILTNESESKKLFLNK